MSFKPYESSENIINFYKRYLLTTFVTNDADYKQMLEDEISKPEAISKGPFIHITDPYKFDKSLQDLIKQGIVTPEMNNVHLFNADDKLFVHQVEAMEKYRNGENLIVTTGTGSGKTKTFMLPVIDQLLKEKESNGGMLKPGVRVLIIYPMNALVNDQMNEWERVLRDEPEITFAHLTSETPRERPANDMTRTNYIKYRAEIYANPPHILITNYAMLERILLVPDSGNLFLNPDNNENLWKTIILDEAHSYKGTLGIEMSALLRRLRARVNRESIRYILTSATLGDNKDDIADFGRRLCSENFTNNSVVFATFQPLNQGLNLTNNYSLSDYTELSRALENDDYQLICQKLGIQLTTDSELIAKELFDELKNEEFVKRVRDIFKSNNNLMTLDAATNQLNITNKEQFTDFIAVASFAGYEDNRIFDAKYHLFIKGIDGVFVTLDPNNKKLFVKKRETYTDPHGIEHKVYKLSACDKCGALYIAGIIDQATHILKQEIADDEADNVEFYTLDQSIVINGDEGRIVSICPICGKLADARRGLTCGHQNNCTPYTLYHVNARNGQLHKCPCCGNSNSINNMLRPFSTGSDASTAVIGTALYNELPDDRKKQFLIFSDSRQKAAKFVSSMGDEYKNYLIKRLMVIVADEHTQELINGINFETFVGYLADKICNCHIFDEERYEKWRFNQSQGRLDNILHQAGINIQNADNDTIENTYYDYWFNDNNESNKVGRINRSAARFHLLEALINYQQKNSLMKKGGLFFTVDLANANIAANDKVVYQVMLQQFISAGAIYADGDQLLDKDFKSFFDGGIRPEYRERGLRRNDNEWLPNGTGRGRRGELIGFPRKLARMIGDENIALGYFQGNHWGNIQGYLTQQWRRQGQHARANEGYVLNTNNIVIKKTPQLYKCDKCGIITPYNINDVCPKGSCDGRMRPFGGFNSNIDHYAWLYQNLKPISLDISEHTAQLSSSKAKEYQNRFSIKHNGLNALSCTTTFEMGINVGSLQTVLMRNMPPSPANYVQRSGRAGRSKSSASFTVTFCPSTPHDRYYYRFPEKMICGSIIPPHFNEENEVVLMRHIFVTALSDFWQNNPNYFPIAQPGNGVDRFTSQHRLGEFYEGTNTHVGNGFEVFKQFIDGRNNNLTDLLLRSFPASLQNCINNYSWVDRFYNNLNNQGDALLSRALNKYNDKLRELGLKINDLMRLQQYNWGIKIESINRTINRLKNQDLIGFLSHNAIIPQYGFPTDIVSLDVDNSDIDLSRSLSLAIFEYAPENEVYVDKNTYLSRYIKTNANYTLPRFFFHICPNCKALIKVGNENENVVRCDCGTTVNNPTRECIIPWLGFRSGGAGSLGNLRYRYKSYRSAITYVGGGSNNNAGPKTIRINNIIELTVRQSKDDHLAIVNSKEYYFCRRCGFATSNQADFNNHITGFIYTDENGQIIGRDNPDICPVNNAEIVSIGCELVTDVTILSCIGVVFNYQQAITILYAILEGLNKALNLERNEVSGCIKASNGSYDLVLFDRAPGGAGYVKTLYDYPNVYLKDMLIKAFELVSSCTCGGAQGDSACYDCLCNYGNQSFHDIMKRRYAIEFFQLFAQTPQDITSVVDVTNVPAPIPTPIQVVPVNTIVISGRSFNNMQQALLDIQGYMNTQDDQRVYNILNNASPLFNSREMPKVNCRVAINGQTIKCRLIWERSRVAVFDEGQGNDMSLLQQCGWNCYITTQIQDENTLLSLIN